MVAKSQIKLIKSLQQKKYRIQHGLFVVEGKKMVRELLASPCEVYKVFAEKESLSAFPPEYSTLAAMSELKQMSSLKSPSAVIGVFYIPKPAKVADNDWILALDDLRDPGNLGTIIRLCDWFGIRHLVCSNETVDCYNPKVLQATMGSIARVNLVYTDLYDFLGKIGLPIYGTFMDGIPIYNREMPRKGVLVMGNEGRGISQLVEKLCIEKVSIPQFGKSTTESLNVATASAIFLSELRRR